MSHALVELVELAEMTRFLFPALRLLAPITLGVVAMGCQHHHSTPVAEDVSSEDSALVSDSSDTLEASSQSTTFAKPFFVSLDQTTASDANASAKAAADGAAIGVAGFAPAGCATVVSSGASAIATFQHCTGAFGLDDVSGSVHSDFTFDDGGRLALTIADGSDLTINGDNASYTATLAVSFNGTDRVVTWNAMWTARSHRGRLVHHESSFNIALQTVAGGDHCVDISGVTHGWVETPTRGLSTVIDGFHTCPAACPSAGTINATGVASHRALTLIFDGTPDVTVEGPRGLSYQAPIDCE